KNDIDHERNPSPKSVAEQTEDERAYRAHREGNRNRVTEIGDAHTEIMRHRHDHKRQQKKIECVQRPAKKTGDKRIALVAIEELKKPYRFHSVFQLFPSSSDHKLETPRLHDRVRKMTSALLGIGGVRSRQHLYSLASSLGPVWLGSSISSNGR